MSKWDALKGALDYVSTEWNMAADELTPMWLSTLMDIAEEAEANSWNRRSLEQEMEDRRRG